MDETNHNGDDAPHSIHVERGRLNSTLRDALRELGVVTSTTESPDDVMITIVRDIDGRMTLDTTRHFTTGAIDDLLPLCWSVVAGANLTGRIAVRVRRGDHGPVFVSVEER